MIKQLARYSRFALALALVLNFVHEDPNARNGATYNVLQALIARGVIGDFRAPDVLRFGFSPLYLSFAEIDRAADALVQILATRSWDQPRFTARRTVT